MGKVERLKVERLKKKKTIRLTCAEMEQLREEAREQMIPTVAAMIRRKLFMKVGVHGEKI